MIPADLVPYFKTKLVRVAEKLMRHRWKTQRCIDVCIFCAECPEMDALFQFQLTMSYIAHLVLRPALVTVSEVDNPMVVNLAPGSLPDSFYGIQISIERHSVRGNVSFFEPVSDDELTVTDSGEDILRDLEISVNFLS